MTIRELRNFLNGLNEDVLDCEIYASEIVDFAVFNNERMSLIDDQTEDDIKENGLLFDFPLLKDEVLMVVPNYLIEEIETFICENK